MSQNSINRVRRQLESYEEADHLTSLQHCQFGLDRQGQSLSNLEGGR